MNAPVSWIRLLVQVLPFKYLPWNTFRICLAAYEWVLEVSLPSMEVFAMLAG